MVKNNVIKFLVDQEQLVKIKQNASDNGFKTVSDYLRELSLNRDNRGIISIIERLYSIELALKKIQKAK